MTAKVLIGRSRVALALSGLLLVASVAGCSGADDETPGGAGDRTATGPADPGGEGPLAGATLYVDPSAAPVQHAARWKSTGRTADAEQLYKIASQPIAHWLIWDSPGQVRTETDRYVARAAAAGKLPVLVAYHIPNRDCGSYSAGGAADVAQYRNWIRAVADGIGDRPAVVIVEPDAVAHTLGDGCQADSQARYDLLKDAVEVLKGRSGTRVYLDAGNPTWVRDIGQLAEALRRAGIDRADGFALNVSNFVTTEQNVDYGVRLSDALGGKRFVIDTSRNGKGPWPGGTEVDGGPAWCNPPGRALGTAPTTGPGLPRVDALLWVKRPGDSDGDCRPGEPPAGQWWPEYALALARGSA